jgi:phosphoribosylformylglycinamidine (FGAM) synthase PurS component
VRVGRLVELEVADPGQLEEMCERLLCNPLIEDYEIAAPVDSVREAERR